ncbi:hypothetical protein ABZ202_17730 [Streptomyces sp. NPDC006186]|uniref:hypothetical protein n=1 Tax=Streptomyces sp. NPDC006186 TaxID=3155248 RepID=UPI0033B1C009
MADEHTVLPGDGARATGRWLDRDTADRLLNGEPLDHLTPPAREQAERIADALGALAVTATPDPTAALPGEEAALAAFRAARDTAAGEGTADGERACRPAAEERAADVGLVRIGPAPAVSGAPAAPGRARRFRPARLALAAALTVGMVGGVAVAAGSGALRSPFDGPAAPGPAATVSADVTPAHPLTPPTPTGTAVPDGDAPGTTGPDAGDGTARDGAATGDPGAPAASGSPDADPGRTADARACRELHAGHSLDDGRRHALEGAAGGPARVRAYCRGVLAGDRDTGTGPGRGADGDDNGRHGARGDHDRPKSHGKGKGNGEGKGNGNGKGSGKGQGDGKGRGGSDGDGRNGDDEDHDGRRGNGGGTNPGNGVGNRTGAGNGTGGGHGKGRGQHAGQDSRARSHRGAHSG